MRNRKQKYPCIKGCPVEITLNVIGGKWKGVILYHLISGTKRYGELKNLVKAITPRVLALQLRELEEDGIIIRTVYPEVPPKTEYQLSKLGETLENIILEMEKWGTHFSQLHCTDSDQM